VSPSYLFFVCLCLNFELPLLLYVISQQICIYDMIQNGGIRITSSIVIQGPWLFWMLFIIGNIRCLLALANYFYFHKVRIQIVNK